MNDKHAWLVTMLVMLLVGCAAVPTAGQSDHASWLAGLYALLGAVCFLVASYLRVAKIVEEGATQGMKDEGRRFSGCNPEKPWANLPELGFLDRGEPWQR